MAVLYSGLSSASHKPAIQPFKRRAYVCNGWDRMLVWDGIETSAVEAGITGPGTEPTDWTPSPSESPSSPGVTAGTHLVRYRYKDSTTGYLSNPSNSYEVTASGSNKFSFPISTSGAGNIRVSSDAKVDTIVVEMTDVGLEVFYVGGEGDNTSGGTVEVTRSDTELREEGEITYPETGHTKPPYARYMVPFKDRLFVFGQVRHSDGSVSATNGDATVTGSSSNWTQAVEGRFLQFAGENRVYEIASYTSATELELRETYQGSSGSAKGYVIFSRSNEIFYSHAGYPEGFPSGNAFQALSEEAAKAVVGFGSSLLIYGLRTIERFTYDLVPEAGVKYPVPGNRGALNQDVVVPVDNQIYSMDQQGMFVYNGGEPEHISRRVDEKIRAEVDFNFASKFHAVFYPKLRALRWFVVMSGETECRMYFEYDVDRDVWCSGLLDFAVTFSGQAPRGQGIGVFVGDEDGGQWWDDVGTTIGGDTSNANATVDAGATTTDVPLDTTNLPTSGNGLRGVPVYFPASGESRRVQSNTATTLTLDTALSGAPSEGDTCYLGRIVGKLRTKEFSVVDLKEKARPTWAYLKWKPTAFARTMKVRMYKNGLSAARTDWGAASYASAHATNEGVTVPASGESDFLIDTSKPDGTTRIGLGLDGVRTFSLEIEIDQPDVDFELYEIQVGSMHERSSL